ncbi:MAG TPA: GNAT family N-acetyltransferase, partial [Tepidisphaeraceae bacterium]|nr:GNAT family N-acetyltransferase [Tepidisphaeraceae bacterium]
MKSNDAGMIPSIRLAAACDLAAINDIYNYYVLHSTCTYQEEPDPLESRRQWFAHHGPDYPVTVATLDDRVVGWGSLSPYHPRSAYRFTVENSVYVHNEFHRRGIGSAILADLID